MDGKDSVMPVRREGSVSSNKLSLKQHHLNNSEPFDISVPLSLQLLSKEPINERRKFCNKHICSLYGSDKKSQRRVAELSSSTMFPVIIETAACFTNPKLIDLSGQHSILAKKSCLSAPSGNEPCCYLRGVECEDVRNV